MFTHHCDACDRTQLIFHSQVTSVTASAEGARATFTCWCGADQTAVLSLLEGGAAPVSPAVTVAA